MLRDKFAMAAMQGFCANPDSHAQEWSTGEVAQYAYAQADAMMKERANWDFSKDPEHPMHLEPLVRYHEGCAVGKSQSLDIAATELYNECVEKAALDSIKKMLSEAVVRKHNITQHGKETIAQLIEQLET